MDFTTDHSQRVRWRLPNLLDVVSVEPKSHLALVLDGRIITGWRGQFSTGDSTRLRSAGGGWYNRFDCQSDCPNELAGQITAWFPQR